MGSGGILSPITDTLFGKAKAPEQTQVDIPDPIAPAPPAPSRKVDTGAIVKVGQTGMNDRLSGQGSGSTRRSASSLSGLGRGAGISI
jgi:type II secretory pathway component HofQ